MELMKYWWWRKPRQWQKKTWKRNSYLVFICFIFMSTVSMTCWLSPRNQSIHTRASNTACDFWQRQIGWEGLHAGWPFPMQFCTFSSRSCLALCCLVIKGSTTLGGCRFFWASRWIGYNGTIWGWGLILTGLQSVHGWWGFPGLIARYGHIWIISVPWQQSGTVWISVSIWHIKSITRPTQKSGII